jgi:hypothetical protein
VREEEEPPLSRSIVVYELLCWLELIGAGIRENYEGSLNRRGWAEREDRSQWLPADHQEWPANAISPFENLACRLDGIVPG